MAKPKRNIEEDLADEMFRKFLHGNLYYFIAVLSMTLAMIFAVQGVLYHMASSIGAAIIFYFFAVILFVTGKVYFGRGMQNYKYH